jgi:hypothetical protein
MVYAEGLGNHPLLSEGIQKHFMDSETDVIETIFSLPEPDKC